MPGIEIPTIAVEPIVIALVVLTLVIIAIAGRWGIGRRNAKARRSATLTNANERGRLVVPVEGSETEEVS